MKYLAYGANMDKDVMASRCRGAKFLGTGILQDYRLMFKGETPNAYATIEEWCGFRVPYVLWEITAADERRLDKFEGYPNFYQKAETSVELGGKKFCAMYYYKPPEQPIGQPMTHYVDVLDMAYDYYKFDKTILDEALRLSDDYYRRVYR